MKMSEYIEEFKEAAKELLKGKELEDFIQKLEEENTLLTVEEVSLMEKVLPLCPKEIRRKSYKKSIEDWKEEYSHKLTLI